MTTTDRFAAFRAKSQFGSLDGIRALCIIGVVWHHAGPEQLLVPLQRGFLGVDLFFAISGFLIVSLLLRERDKTGAISLRRFYARRALRIFPLYYAVLLLAFVASRASSSTHALALRDDLPYALMYVSNWVDMHSLLSITWSLSAEEQFYVAWPPLMVLAGPRKSVVVLAAAIACSVALVLLHEPLALDLPNFLWQTSFLPILLGVALAHLLHQPHTFGAVARVVGGRFASLVALAGLAAMLCWPDPDIAGLPRIVIHLLMAVFLAACVLREDHVLAPVLRFAPLARIGVLSYGIYLLHMFARHVTAKATAPLAEHGDLLHGLALFGSTLALTVALAEVSYRFFEARFLRLKVLFEPGRRTPL